MISAADMQLVGWPDPGLGGGLDGEAAQLLRHLGERGIVGHGRGPFVSGPRG
jgi:hypothetical protein